MNKKQNIINQPLHLRNNDVSDWNDIYTAGWFSGNTGKNAPVSGWISAISIPYNGNGDYPCLIATNGERLFIRRGDRNAWNEWKEVSIK